MYTVIFSNTSIKSLKKLPKVYQVKIKKLTTKLEKDPFSADIKKLSGDNKATHRIRTGSYKIFLFINDKTKEVFIVDINRRTTQTYR